MLIGIHGPAGSGKSTAARVICDYFDAIILPFAKPLKDFAAQLGWDGLKDEKGRRLLQLLGTECGRKCICEHIWVQHWMKMYDPSRNTVADDIRFENEITAIMENKGFLIKLVGRKFENVPTHESEQELPDQFFNYVVDNSCNLPEFKERILKICQELLENTRQGQ
jgi:hypothetical protein